MTGRFDTSRATVYLSEGYALFYYFQFAVRWLSHVTNGIYEPRQASAALWTEPFWSVYRNRQPFAKSRPSNGWR